MNKKQISNYTVSTSDAISLALKKLQDNDLKLIVVLDKENKLIGTITDGDVRRGLLKNIETTESCSKIMNKKPKFVIKNGSSFTKHKLSKEPINAVIVDEEMSFIDIERHDNTTNPSAYDNIVVIMAGGKGERLLPLTLKTPKPLLSINNTPIIQSIISSFNGCGFNNIYISVHHKSDEFIKFFSKKPNNVNKVKIIKENKPLGTAGCLSLLDKDKVKKPIIVINGDVLTNIDYEKLLDFHLQSKKDITICAAEYHNTIPFGTIIMEDGLITNIEEKPSSKHLINAGIYVLSPDIIKSLKRNTMINMTDIIEEKININNISVYPIHEKWIDIGNIDDFKKASEKFEELI
tara:strand:+ start:3649 stop:4695 length:1047 start_codon:yes stop_codon:yes gene_type:complete